MPMQKATALAFAASSAFDRLAKRLCVADPTRDPPPDAPAPRLAWLLRITPSSIYQWVDTVPETSAYKLEIMTRGRLRAEEKKEEE